MRRSRTVFALLLALVFGLASVAAGVCAALLPRLALDPGQRTLEIASLPAEFEPRVIALVRRSDRYSTSAMADFVQTSVEVCAHLLERPEPAKRVRLAG